MEKLTEVLYVRIPKRLRKELERIASSRLISYSDAAREVLLRGLADVEANRLVDTPVRELLNEYQSPRSEFEGADDSPVGLGRERKEK